MRNALLIIISLILFYLTFAHNIFKTAHDDGYMSIRGFQRDSETAVVHPIVSGKIWSSGWFLLNGRTIWSAFQEYHDQMKPIENYMTPLNINDAIWTNGINNKNSEIIIVDNNSINRELNKVGANAIFKYGISRQIISVSDVDKKLKITFDKPIYQGVGYPYMYNTDSYMPLTVYKSNMGIITYFFTSIARLYPPVWFYNYLTAFLLSLTLSLIVFCINKEFGISYSVVFTISCIFSIWLVVMGQNLIHQAWLMFVPMLFMGIYLKTKKCTYAWLCFIFLIIKFLQSFEFITTVCVAMCVPMVYFAVSNGGVAWIWKLFCRLLLWVGISVVAFSISVVATINTEGHSYDALVKKAQHRLFQTTGDDKKSRVSIINNIKQYAGGKPFKSSELQIWHLMFMSAICALPLIKSKNRKSKALAVATVFSIIAPLSWYIIAAQHSHVHLHINHVLWVVPFVPMAFMLILATFNAFIARLWCKKLSHATVL